MARRRSRRRKNSYHQDESTGFPPELVIEDLSPRARRLVDSGVIDLSVIAGSGEKGRITSGDILHAARVMEVEQSVARIETVRRDDVPTPAVDPKPEPVATGGRAPESETAPDAIHVPPSEEPDPEDPGMAVAADEPVEIPDVTDDESTSAADVTVEPVAVPPNPWEAYNGMSEGLAESARPGAEQSWGEAEANIAAIAEEAAAQIYGRAATSADSPAPPIVEVPEVAAHVEAPEELIGEGDTAAPQSPDEPTAVVAALSDAEAVVDPEPEIPDQPLETEPTPVPEVAESVVVEEALVESDVAAAEMIEAPNPELADELIVPANDPAEQPQAVAPEDDAAGKATMGFGTLEAVDPASVWAEGAEYFAPWFLAHSRQLGDALGLEAGLSDARQFTTKSATGVLGLDDNGEEVVVVSTENAVADDSDLGRALGMVASSGASTVALVSAKFHEEQLQALEWLNNQSKSGVLWYAIEMKVVRIADSPAAMLFDLVAAPPSA